MKLLKGALLAIGTAAIAALPVSVSVSAQDDTTLSEGEMELAEMLEGRIPGEPQSCISIRPNTDVTIIDETAIVYEVGQTLYVNIPRNARFVDDNDTLVRRTSFPTRLCKVDIITTIDRFTGFYTGNVALGDFIPYRKADS